MPPKISEAEVSEQWNRNADLWASQVRAGWDTAREYWNNPAFLEFAGLCFRQKRKTLRNNLVGTFGKTLVDGLPEASRRAEQLTLEQFAELYRKLATGSSVS